MAEYITLLRPGSPPPSSERWLYSALPPDLLEQIRSRVRLLALFLTIGFAIDPVLYFANYGAAVLTGVQLPSDFLKRLPFQWTNLGAMAASATLWGVTRHPRLTPSRLLTLGLVYEVIICFVIAFGTIWEYYLVTHQLPLMTWVYPVVILFPVILPGPPRRMLIGAICAAAMMPVSLVLLHVWDIVPVTLDAVIDTLIQGGFSVALAYMGSRVMYGMGREVAKARELGSYRLEEKLGQGGMGEVWRARHRMLARPAAIKLIRRSPVGDPRTGISEDSLRRFEREAQVIASLRSPHTVGLFDFGVAQDGTFYYAMELLEGLDADTLVRRFGPVVPERVIYLLQQVCHSLTEAESYGLVHRDIKPANIFLCRYGVEFDFVKVLDFGLVKTLDGGTPETGAGAETAPPLTRENVIQGTPAYMAPEQALGGVPLNSKADMYATGCVAYWLLTGQLVFSADTPLGLLMHHARTPPTPPSARSELPIPEALDRLVLSCLAKDPADRPHAKELSRQLAAVGGANVWTEERARDWWAKHRPALAQGVGQPPVSLRAITV
jgi:serine/threonine-protein kinase